MASVQSIALHQVPAAARSPYFSNKEASDYLRLSPRTLEKYRMIGGGPRFHKLGRRVVYCVTDLRDWADRRIFDTTADTLEPNSQGHEGAAWRQKTT